MPIVNLPSRASAQFASFGSVLISSFNANPAVADLDLLFAHQRALVKLYGHVSGLSLISSDGIGGINEDLKRHSVEMTKATSCLGVATVVRGDGLKAGLVRACLTGLSLLSTTRYPIRVASSIDEGLEWLLERPGQLLSARRLTSAAVLKHFNAVIGIANAA